MGWEKIIMRSEHLLVSYPRSGSNYFQLAWREKTKQHIECLRSSKMVYGISEDNDKKIVGLIRSPIEAITSRILIVKTHEYTAGTEYDVVKFSISEYVKIYHYIVKNADYIVDISDLDKIDKLVETISGVLSDPVDDDVIKDKLKQIPDYSTTFVAHKDYEAILSTVKGMDLELCQALYEIAYSKRLMV
jgi:hypothetical protein